MSFGQKNIVSLEGEHIRTLIRDHGLTQRAVAKRIGMHDVSFANLLGGWRNTTEQRARRLALVLGVELEEIVKNDQEGTDIAA